MDSLAIKMKEKEKHLQQMRQQERLAESDMIYDHITEFAADLCGTPMALINLVDKDRFVVKSGFGLDIKELPRENSFCAHTMMENGLLEVGDARVDNRFRNYSVVKKEQVIFYAGIPIVDNTGLSIGTLSIIDTKPRKLSEKQKRGLRLFARQVADMLEINKMKNRYETLIESSHDLIYKLDENGKFIFANQSTIRATGYSMEELQNMTCWEMIDEGIREEVKAYYINKIKEGETSIYYEFPIVSRSGNTIWLGQSVDYVFEKDRVTKAYVIAKDVSELVQIRLMLKESEEQVMAEKNILNMMVFSSPAAIAMFSKDFKYLAFSEKWDLNQEINEQVIGLNSSGTSIDQNDLLDSIKEKILRGETIGKENDLVITKDGDERWIKWVATPWNNTTDGSIGGVIVYTDDVTHIINHEAELEKARKEAVKSSKIKEDFLSSMSHEIRTPLNAIIGTTNLMMEENAELAQDEKFKLLKFSSNNLLALINNVLDFSKIESGNIEIENGDFEIRTLTNSLVNSWKPLANQKGLDLILKCDDRIPEVVKGDSVRLSQVLNNLVNNAVKFTEEGSVEVKIEPDPKQQNGVCFEIMDTGIGIPKRKQKEVFESFRQVTSHLSEQGGGTGLGLPICQKLVRMMGSEIILISEEGEGSKFSFTITLEEGSELKVPEIVEANDNKQLDIQVLLVEDNAANQFIAKSFLEKWGVRLGVASNGLEALNHIKTMSYDLVLLDLRMPVMDGYTCAKRIREMEGDYYQKVPIIALTASTIQEVRKQGSVLAFDDFLGKPFDPQKLYRMVMKYADRVLELDQSIVTHNISDDIQEPKIHARQGAIAEHLASYTEGDAEFLKEFAENISDNLEKIRSGVPKCLVERDIEGLSDLVHMVKPTIEIIGQQDLLEALNDLRAGWKRERIDEDVLLKVLEMVDENIELLKNILADSKTAEAAEA